MRYTIAIAVASLVVGSIGSHPPERIGGYIPPTFGQIFNGRSSPLRERVDFELQRRARVIEEDVVIPGREVTFRTPDRVIRQERVIEEVVEVPVIRTFAAPVCFEVPVQLCAHDFAFPAARFRERANFDIQSLLNLRNFNNFNNFNGFNGLNLRERFAPRGGLHEHESIDFHLRENFGERERGGFFGGGRGFLRGRR